MKNLSVSAVQYWLMLSDGIAILLEKEQLIFKELGSEEKYLQLVNALRYHQIKVIKSLRH